MTLSLWCLQVQDSPDRFFPASLVVVTELTEAPQQQQQQPGGQAPPPPTSTRKGYEILVGCCVLGGGSGEVVFASVGEGEAMMNSIRSALAWARLHRSTLLRLFSNRPERVDLRRRDLDYYMDFGLEHLQLTGPSVSWPVFLKACLAAAVGWSRG